LCIAVQVNDSFGTVWSASPTYAASNEIGWAAAYQLYVRLGRGGSHTGAVSIAKGQSATLSSSAVLDTPTAGGPAQAVTLVNQDGWVRPALQQWISGVGGAPGFRDCYLADAPIAEGQTSIYPADIVKIWFSQDGQPLPAALQSGHALSTVATVDLTAADSAARRYQGGTWHTP
jgi:hypothetical protein